MLPSGVRIAIVLLPLYPHFSTTTTGALTASGTRRQIVGLSVPTSEICCWPEADGFVSSVATATDHAIEKLDAGSDFRVLFQLMASEKIVDGGDPYAHQVERTATAVLSRMKTQCRSYSLLSEPRRPIGVVTALYRG